ncbi:succinate-semialdehyde dehydrogenase/glutarate-semialdehyde dehydrogenase [Inquilinus ginsengisoli]|uniref:NAD-dependent succinate-semialdehyde dehydrogenase n=1 Tax=Inquilinus ginsengisoli TaxID=363840 RepID=UPI003D1CAA93
MTYLSINPFTEEPIAAFTEHSDAELSAILAQADTTFREDWRKRPFDARKAVLKQAAAILRERRDDLARIATTEMGKLYVEALGEVALCADIFDYYADRAEAILAARDLDVREGKAHIETSPIGPIFCIEPWNFPYYQLARVAGPNLMAGNTIIVKHAPGVPQCALAFEKVLLDAGAPLGAYTNVFLTNDQAATAIADPRVRGVALTGSERAGAAVAAAAGKALKKSTMELGGSDAFIVLDDADLETAVRLAVGGRMMNTGQACTGSKRFIVHASIAEAFTAGFREELEKLVPGDPLDGRTKLGPLTSRAALDHVLQQIEQGVAGGAKVVTGGRKLDRRGYFLAPTILTEVAPTNPVFHQEFFAPVAMVFAAENEEEAIKLANDSPYGLGGAVISPNVERAKRVASRLDIGMVFINSTPTSAPELPFGGVKNSGYGRELSDLGIAEFVNRKLVRVT